MGMRAAMWLLSPKFRPHVDNFADRMVEAIQADLRGQGQYQAVNPGEGPGNERREAERGMGNARGRAGTDTAGVGQHGGGEVGGATGSGQSRGSRISRFQNLLRETLGRGQRTPEPFTEDSAALARVGITQNAYDEMRRPGADRKKVRENYQNALSALDERVSASGLDRAAVDRNMRVVVGELMERDPAQAAVFAEVGHGRLVKSAPQTVVVPGTTQTRQLWNGDYVDAYGGSESFDGSFALREPMSANEHWSEASRTMYGELASARTPEEFGETMRQYVIGSAAREYPEMVGMTDDPEAHSRMNRSRAMFSSMRDDGLSDQDQKLVYAGALSEATRTLENTHPEMVAEWRRSLGPEWEQETQRLIEEYRDFGEKAESERERQQDEQARASADQEATSEQVLDNEAAAVPESRDRPETVNEVPVPEQRAPRDEHERDDSPEPFADSTENPGPTDNAEPVSGADPRGLDRSSEVPGRQAVELGGGRPDATQQAWSERLRGLAATGTQAWSAGSGQQGPGMESPRDDGPSR
ncbi:hypothetical protein [Nocardiopsis sp. NPDC058789]|uniref:hypothetical protein n=1 Tax=Nocardiopsis sp. NPDC058789 TaxID=3346634 RepID=UPI0036708F33